MISYFTVHSKADMSLLNLLHGTKNWNSRRKKRICSEVLVRVRGVHGVSPCDLFNSSKPQTPKTTSAVRYHFTAVLQETCVSQHHNKELEDSIGVKFYCPYQLLHLDYGEDDESCRHWCDLHCFCAFPWKWLLVVLCLLFWLKSPLIQLLFVLLGIVNAGDCTQATYPQRSLP